jgi:aryl-alcohol dehydrogenase-like predicted oxidoreductase
MQILHGQAFPFIQKAIQVAAQAIQATGERSQLERWVQAYAMAIENLSRAMQEHVAATEHTRSLELHTRLDKLAPAAWRTQSLSQMALRTLLAVPGVTCVLNGMRSPEYVRDSLGALTGPPNEGAEGLGVLKGWRS